MKRHEALIPLSHDHHHALAQVRRMRHAAGVSDEARTEAAREFLGFFRNETVGHFREEEEIVFPLLVDEAEARSTLERATFEHLQIHARVLQLETEVARGSVSEASLVRIADLLEGHIRFEEKVLFPMAQTLHRSDLDQVTLQPRHREMPEPAVS